MGLIEIGTGVILSRAGCGVVGDREVRPFSVVGVQRALTCIALQRGEGNKRYGREGVGEQGGEERRGGKAEQEVRV